MLEPKIWVIMRGENGESGKRVALPASRVPDLVEQGKAELAQPDENPQV